MVVKSIEMKSNFEPMVQVQYIFIEMFLIMPSTECTKMSRLRQIQGPQLLLIRNILQWTRGPKSKAFHRNVPHNARYQKMPNINGSAPSNKMTAIPIDK